jgi:hypothetical protein
MKIHQFRVRPSVVKMVVRVTCPACEEQTGSLTEFGVCSVCDADLAHHIDAARAVEERDDADLREEARVQLHATR